MSVERYRFWFGGEADLNISIALRTLPGAADLGRQVFAAAAGQHHHQRDQQRRQGDSAGTEHEKNSLRDAGKGPPEHREVR